MKIEQPPGATPLEIDEDLIPNIATQGDLNEFEAQNIGRGDQWARGNTRLRREFPTVSTLLQLHKQMFGDTWKWAGKFRGRDLSIGIDWQRIPEQVVALCGNTRYWIENNTFPWPEAAVRFHHRLVVIHPFFNGNGRHARLAADLLLEINGQPRLGWGGGALVEKSERRVEYIAALQEADQHRFDRILEFAQSR